MKKFKKENIEDIIALSPLQKGILFVYLNEPKGRKYFQQLCLKTEDDINHDIFTKAWQYVVDNNQMLRTIFRWEKLDNPIQIVLKTVKVPIKFFDFSGEQYDKAQILTNKVKSEDIEQGFDFVNLPFKITLIKTQLNEYEMVISNHHILYDGWSNGIILREFLDAYYCLKRGIYIAAKRKSKFKEFIKYIGKKDIQKSESYWKYYLEDFSAKTKLPVSDTLKVKKGLTSTYICNIDKELSDRIDRYAKQEKVTIATLFYCAWGILLQKYSSKDDVLFGTTISGRKAEIKDIDNMVGLFINTIPLRVKTNENTTILQLLKNLYGNLVEREDYEYTSLTDIKMCSEIHGGESLFDSIVVVENYPIDKKNNSKNDYLNVNLDSAYGVTNFLLTLRIMMLDELQLQIIYYEDAFEAWMIKGIANHFINILTEIVHKPNVQISEINMLNKSEKNMILYDFNKFPPENNPNEITIHQMFNEQVCKTPNKIAVVCENVSITYKELNAKSEQLACVLRSRGLGKGCVAGLMLGQSIDLIVGILGIIKAGCAYLPIDYEYPMERIRYMLEDCRAKVLITKEQLEKNRTFEIDIVDINKLTEYESKVNNCNYTINPEDPIYVIYTSGTTGKPKGIVIENRNLVNYVKWFVNKNRVSIEDKTMLLSSYCFDLGYTSLYSSLLSGAELHLLPKPSYIDCDNLVKYIQLHKITYLKTTPSFFNLLINSNGFVKGKACSSLRLVVLGGEKIQPSQIRKYNIEYPKTLVMNHYGPTETTIGVIVHYINFEKFKEFEEKPVIGKPIDNIQVYILDLYNKLSPIGIIGEICIAGNGLARGYINNEEINASKFIYKNINGFNIRLYKTGDLGRFLPDGNVEFLSRVDKQIKIRGFRIEIAEIESAILKYKGVNSIIVTVKEFSVENKHICAYFLAERSISTSEIKDFLTKELPNYMIPTYIIQVDEFPLGSNGKVDKSKLIDPSEYVSQSVKCELTKTEVEKELSEIWNDVLNTKNIGLNDNFFDVGGNSLLLMKMHNQINKSFPDSITIAELFSFITISQIAQFINNKIQVKENKVHIRSIKFPRNYFIDKEHRINDHIGNRYSMIKYRLSNKILDKIVMLQEVENIGLQTTFLAVFAYLIGNISSRQEFDIQINKAGTNNIIQLHINLANISEFTALFSEIDDAIMHSSSGSSYSVSEQADLHSIKLNKTEYSVVPLLSTADELVVNVENVFDIIFEILVNGDEIDIICRYDFIRFHKVQIEELFNKYIYIFESLVMEY